MDINHSQFTVTQHVMVGTAYIVVTVWDDSKVVVSVSDVDNLWKTEVYDRDLQTMKDRLGMDISMEKFRAHVKACLTKRPDGAHSLGFLRTSSSTLELQLQVSEEIDITVILGVIGMDIQPRSTVQRFLFDVISKLQERHNTDNARLGQIATENKKLQANYEKALNDLDSHVTKSTSSLEEAYTCFKELINTKKRKIRELEARLSLVASSPIDIKTEDVPIRNKPKRAHTSSPPNRARKPSNDSTEGEDNEENKPDFSPTRHGKFVATQSRPVVSLQPVVSELGPLSLLSSDDDTALGVYAIATKIPSNKESNQSQASESPSTSIPASVTVRSDNRPIKRQRMPRKSSTSELETLLDILD